MRPCHGAPGGHVGGVDAHGRPRKSELVHAIYERIVVAGRRIVSTRLTPAAYEHGLAVALPENIAVARPAGFEPATWWSEATRSIH